VGVFCYDVFMSRIAKKQQSTDSARLLFAIITGCYAVWIISGIVSYAQSVPGCREAIPPDYGAMITYLLAFLVIGALLLIDILMLARKKIKPLWFTTYWGQALIIIGSWVVLFNVGFNSTHSFAQLCW